MASLFQAPRILASWRDVVAAFRLVQESLDRISRSGYVLGLATRDLTPACPSFQRVSPPAGGLRCVLPRADQTNAGQAIVLNLENPLGDLTVFAAPGQEVCGAATATFNVAGVVELFSNGVDGWFGFAQTPVGGAGASPWTDVLAVGNTTGGQTPTISSGDALHFASGATGITADDELTLQSTGNMHLHPSGQLHLGHDGVTSEIHAAATGDIAVQTGAGVISLSSDSGLWATTNGITLQPGGAFTVTAGNYVWLNPTGIFYLYTNATSRLVVDTFGAWNLAGSDPGSTSQVLTSNGSGSPPTWAFPSVLLQDGGSNVARFITLNFVDGTNTTAVVTDSGLGVASVAINADLSSVTYTAGDGIDLASNVFSADVSDFAGAGLEDDGANNLRIAAAAAGAGLTGGGGSALAVGAGSGITVNANDVAVNIQAALDLVTSTNHSLLLRQGGSWVGLAPSTNGYHLFTDGSGNIVFDDPTAAGLSCLTLDSTGQLSVVSDSDYDMQSGADGIQFSRSMARCMFWDDFCCVGTAGSFSVSAGGFDYLLGDTPWVIEVQAGGTATFTARDGGASGNSDSPGQLEVHTGTTVGTQVDVAKGSRVTTRWLRASDVKSLKFRFSIQNSANVHVAFGLNDSSFGTGDRAIFDYDPSLDSTIHVRSANSGGATSSDTDSNVSIGLSFREYEIRSPSPSSPDWEYYIDGTLVGTHVTSSKTRGVNVWIGIANLTGSDKSFRLDYVSLETWVLR